MIDPNGFSEEELKSTPQESKERLASLPKTDKGAFDLEAMSPEQKAIFWEERSKAHIRGINTYKQKTDREIEILKKNGVKVDPPAPNEDETNLAKQLGMKSDDASLPVLQRIVKIATDNALKVMSQNPVFVSSVTSGNTARLNEAFAQLSKEEGYESLMDYKDEIISKYFEDINSLPEDALSVLKSLAGGVLYEHRDEIASKNKPKHDRVDMFGGQAGDKKNPTGRSIEYWERFAQEKPQDFAKPEIQKMFNEDMAKFTA